MQALMQLLPALLVQPRTIERADAMLTTEDGQPLATEDGVPLTPEPSA